MEPSDSSIHSVSRLKGGSEEPLRKLLKVITGFVVVSGTIVSLVGLVLIAQVYELQRNRVAEYIEVREDIRDLKKASLIEGEEQVAWRKGVDDRLNSLFRTVNQLVPEIQALKTGKPINPDPEKEPNP